MGYIEGTRDGLPAIETIMSIGGRFEAAQRNNQRSSRGVSSPPYSIKRASERKNEETEIRSERRYRSAIFKARCIESLGRVLKLSGSLAMSAGVIFGSTIVF